MLARHVVLPLGTALSAALMAAGCNPALPLVTRPSESASPTVTPSAFTGPTPPPIEACQPAIYGDALPDPWLRANLKGQVQDSSGAAVAGATIQARITALGNQAELRKAIPPTSRSWTRQPDGTWTCSQIHVLIIGDFTKFTNDSDTQTTTSSPTGAWLLERAPAGATLELKVSKDGYNPLTKTVVARQNPDNTPGVNQVDLILTKP